MMADCLKLPLLLLLVEMLEVYLFVCSDFLASYVMPSTFTCVCVVTDGENNALLLACLPVCCLITT